MSYNFNQSPGLHDKNTLDITVHNPYCKVLVSDEFKMADIKVTGGLYQHLHQPVLVSEIIDHLNIQPHSLYLDATFGLGGYSKAILDAHPSVSVIATDRDPNAQPYAEQLSIQYGNRFQFIQSCFSQLSQRLASYNHQFAGLVFDLGVSSPQLDQADRGFSFRSNGPLDMRMSQSGLDAAHMVNHYSEADLIDIIRRYGEEKFARQIVKSIVKYRTEKPIVTTLELATLIEQVVPRHLQKIHPATRTFQALRIAVNDELIELQAGLDASINLLQNCGRLVVVSFHSLEDRIVKQFIHRHSVHPAVNRHDPQIDHSPLNFVKINNRAVCAQDTEISANPRSRSAKLRAAVRTSHNTSHHHTDEPGHAQDSDFLMDQSCPFVSDIDSNKDRSKDILNTKNTQGCYE